MIIGELVCLIIVLVTCVICLLYAFYNRRVLLNISFSTSTQQIPSFSAQGDDEVLKYQEYNTQQYINEPKISENMIKLQQSLQESVMYFLLQELRRCLIILVPIILFIIFFCEEEIGEFWITVPFIVGIIQTAVSSYVGASISCLANIKCAFKAKNTLKHGFKTGYRAGICIVFFLLGITLFLHTLLTYIYSIIYKGGFSDSNDSLIYKKCFEALLGYPFGVMMTTFLLRMGGISIGYCGGTGTEIVGVISGSTDISMNRHPEVVTWKAGEILSGVVGISTDIFSCLSIIIGSFLYFGAKSTDFMKVEGAYYSVFVYVSLVALLTILLSSIFNGYNFIRETEIETYVWDNIKGQFVFGGILGAGITPIWTLLFIPGEFRLNIVAQPIQDSTVQVIQIYYSNDVMWLVLVGILGILIMGYINAFFVSRTFPFVKSNAHYCRGGRMTTFLHAQSQGYTAALVYIILLVCIVFLSFKIGGVNSFYCLALGTLPYLTLTAILLAAWPIFRSAQAIGKQDVQQAREYDERLASLDSGMFASSELLISFEIIANAVTSLLTVGFYLDKTGIQQFNSFQAMHVVGLVSGSFLPYIYSALYMRTLANLLLQTAKQINQKYKLAEDINRNRGFYEVEDISDLAVDHLNRTMLFTPAILLSAYILVGFFFGREMIGLTLLGSVFGGLNIAITQSNTSGVMINIQDLAGSNRIVDEEGKFIAKGSEAIRAAQNIAYYGYATREAGGRSFIAFYKALVLLCLISVQFFDTFSIFAEEFGLNRRNVKNNNVDLLQSIKPISKTNNDNIKTQIQQRKKLRRILRVRQMN